MQLRGTGTTCRKSIATNSDCWKLPKCFSNVYWIKEWHCVFSMSGGCFTVCLQVVLSCGYNLLISLSHTTTHLIKFPAFAKESYLENIKKCCIFIWSWHHFVSPVVHGTAVTFQWTFLCYGFAKSIQYASPCCMCESLIRTIRTSTQHMATSHNHATPQTQFATMSSYTLNTMQYISIQILLHCVVNMIWPFCSRTNIFQWQFCKAEGGQSMGNLRYWNLRIEICTTYTFPAHW